MSEFISRSHCDQPEQFAERLGALSADFNRKLVFCLADVEDDMTIGDKADERLVMFSPFKLPLAAITFLEADRDRLSMDQFIPFTEEYLVFLSRHNGTCRELGIR